MSCVIKKSQTHKIWVFVEERFPYIVTSPVFVAINENCLNSIELNTDLNGRLNPLNPSKLQFMFLQNVNKESIRENYAELVIKILVLHGAAHEGHPRWGVHHQREMRFLICSKLLSFAHENYLCNEPVNPQRWNTLLNFVVLSISILFFFCNDNKDIHSFIRSFKVFQKLSLELDVQKMSPKVQSLHGKLSTSLQCYSQMFYLRAKYK